MADILAFLSSFFYLKIYNYNNINNIDVIKLCYESPIEDNFSAHNILIFITLYHHKTGGRQICNSTTFILDKMLKLAYNN